MKTLKLMACALSVTALVLTTGCGGEEEVPPPAPMSPTNETTPTPPPAPAAAAPAPVNYVTPQQVVQDPTAALAASEAAIRARQYEEAARAMVMLQRQKALNDAQAAALRANMVRFQGDLANAVANGDPKAKAAAEILRQSAMR